MNYERNKKYLRSRNASYRYIGLGIMGAGIIVMIVCDMFFMMSLMAVGGVIAAAGAALAFIPGMGTADDEEIAEDVRIAFRDVEEKAIDELELRPKLMYIDPQTVSGFSYGGGEYIHVGKDGSWRTSDCTCAQIVFTNLGICIIRLDISLIGDKTERSVMQLPFASYDSTAFVTDKYDVKYGRETKTASFRRLVFYKAGAEVYSLPCNQTSILDIALDDYRRYAEQEIRKIEDLG